MIPSGDGCVTCSSDKSVRLFKVPFAPLVAGPVERDVPAVLEFHGKYGFRCLDHHWIDNKFATGGEKVCNLISAVELEGDQTCLESPLQNWYTSAVFSTSA